MATAAPGGGGGAVSMGDRVSGMRAGPDEIPPMLPIHGEKAKRLHNSMPVVPGQVFPPGKRGTDGYILAVTGTDAHENESGSWPADRISIVPVDQHLPTRRR